MIGIYKNIHLIYKKIMRVSSKRIIGILLLIVGIALIVTSQYIKGRVEKGKTTISHAQKSVDQSKGLSSLSPYSEAIDKTITDPAQKKIDEGQADILYYENLAKQLQIGGIVLILLGIILLIITRKSN